MKDQVISYRQMCDIEKVQTLQRGMNFRLNGNYSVILMSQRHNAPYVDKILADGITIEYEGHDINKTSGIDDPKLYDQPRITKTGRFTQNGLFAKSVEDLKSGIREPELVRVYEKIMAGIWSEKGFFKLLEYKYVKSGNRNVFRFFLEETEIEFGNDGIKENILKPRSRVIPSEIKKIVWERDNGCCVLCGSTDELHFDHELPYSKGGASVVVENVRILCARHNLQKSDKIE